MKKHSRKGVAQLTAQFAEFGKVGSEMGLAAEEAALVTEIVDGAAMFAETIGVDEAAADFLNDLMARSAFVQQIDAVKGAGEEPSMSEDTATSQPAQPAQKSADAKPAAKKEVKTMRVPEHSIDTFLHYVGELVVVGDMYRHLQATVLADPALQGLARKFRRANETFGGLSNQLQNDHGHQ